jgi:serine/threonine protein kinase
VSRSQSRDSASPDLPGYRFIRHLGVGGSAQVYLYEQDLPYREVAVKVLNESALSEAARRRFTAEANVTAGLAHRHIVQVFDAKVTSDGRPYIVMPYYPRPNLLVRARRAHLSVAEVLRIGIQIGSAVETSHRRGVLHRDIKPQNILTDSYGEPALTDFGIATTKGGDGPEGLSVPWSPPEILYGTGAGDQRSDVYSLGATLWHVLAGRSPFEEPGGDNAQFALMGRIKSDPVPPTGRADVPDSLERLLRQAMAKDPAARPQTAMELIRGLQSVEQELRLPVTQPILPASDRGDTQGRETVASQAVRNDETTFSRGYGRDLGNGDSRPPPDAANDRTSAARPGWGPAGQVGSRTQGTPAGQQFRGPTVPSPWGGAAGDATIARGSQPGVPWPAPAGRPATGNGGGGHGPAHPAAWSAPDAVPGDADDPTRARGPRRLEPWSSAPGAQGQQTRAGSQVPPSSWDWMADGGSGGRARQFPPEAPESATLARPRAVAPGGRSDIGPFGATDARTSWRRDQNGSDSTHPVGTGAGDAGRQGKGKSGRMLALAGGGVLLAVVVATAVFGLGHGGGSPGSAPTSGSQATPGGAPVIEVGLGTPTVTARSIGGQQVEFSWHYTGSAPTDSFRVQVNGGSWKPVIPRRPDLVLSVAQGQRVCIQVQVISAGDVGSPESGVSCWPNS